MPARPLARMMMFLMCNWWSSDQGGLGVMMAAARLRLASSTAAPVTALAWADSCCVMLCDVADMALRFRCSAAWTSWSGGSYGGGPGGDPRAERLPTEARPLTIAVELVGPPVIFMDEPTSGEHPPPRPHCLADQLWGGPPASQQQHGAAIPLC